MSPSDDFCATACFARVAGRPGLGGGGLGGTLGTSLDFDSSVLSEGKKNKFKWLNESLENNKIYYNLEFDCRKIIC